MNGPENEETTAEAVVRRYEVELSATVYTTVDVEADSEEAAEAEALDRVKFAYYGWDDDPAFPQVESVREAEA